MSGADASGIGARQYDLGFATCAADAGVCCQDATAFDADAGVDAVGVGKNEVLVAAFARGGGNSVADGGEFGRDTGTLVPGAE